MDKSVEILESEILYQGFLRLRRYRLRHALFEGGVGPELVRERVEGLRAAAVLLYDPDREQLVLVEQFRIGALGSDGGAWVLEPPGGFVPEDESSEQVAIREVREETGCEVRRLEPICEFFVSPGFSNERISLFCGQVDASTADGVHGLDEEGEDIRVQLLSVDEAIAGIGGERINSTSLIIALQWLALNRDGLRRRWLEV